MSRIKGKDTGPELIVRKYLHANGYRYKLNDKTLPGKPDIVLPKYRTVVLVHGCFWHGHKNCKYATIPKTRTEWWTNKIEGNIVNDRKKQTALRKEGWKVIRVWECQLRRNRQLPTLQQLLTKLRCFYRNTYATCHKSKLHLWHVG